jgi:hypothetical protein
MRFDKPVLLNVWKADDDWTGLKEKEERKKRQNRLNQRAYRLRNAPKDPTSAKQRPFRVERFRIAEVTSEITQKDETEASTLKSTIAHDALDPLDLTGSQAADEQGISTDYAAPTSDAMFPDHSIPQEALALLALDLNNPHSSVLSSASANYLHYLQLSRSTPYIQAEPPQPALTILDDALFQLKEEDPFAILKSRLLGNPFGCENSPTGSNFSAATSASQVLSSLDQVLVKRSHFPLSSDHHLLHLIHFNVFRALISNKLLLNDSTFLLRAGNGIVLPRHQNLCEGLTLVRAKDKKCIPPTLYPTTNQMSIAHSSWLNMFPFPRVRDNLIRHQKEFDHRDLCNDLFGELFFRNLQESQYQAAVADVWDSWEDNVTARRRGFIVWGEPWDIDSWEVTPGYLRKWSWTLEGCEDVIVASNKWRAQRGEPPLELITSSGPAEGTFRDINGIARNPQFLQLS